MGVESGRFHGGGGNHGCGGKGSGLGMVKYMERKGRWVLGLASAR